MSLTHFLALNKESTSSAFSLSPSQSSPLYQSDPFQLPTQVTLFNASLAQSPPMPSYATPSTFSSPTRPEYPSLVLSSAPNSPSYVSRIDDASFLSSDLDVSFASVSVDSRPCTPSEEVHQDSIASQHLAQPSPSHSAMDISPAIPRSHSRGPSMSSLASTSTLAFRRNRSNTMGAQRLVFTAKSTAAEPRSSQGRVFGRELSNTSNNTPSSDFPPTAPKIDRNIKATPVVPQVPALLDPKSSETAKPTSAKRRGGLPSLWMADGQAGTIRGKRTGGIFGGQVQFDLDSSPEKSQHHSDAMEIDRSMNAAAGGFITSSPTRPQGAESNDLSSLFFESTSPSAATTIITKKRRSYERDAENQSPTQLVTRDNSGERASATGSRRANRSSSPGSSPSAQRIVPAVVAPVRKFERFATTGATSAGGLFSGSMGKAASRPIPKRPGLNALVSGAESTGPVMAPKSAYPGLYGPNSKRVPSTMSTMPASRRAFSAAQVPPPLAVNMAGITYDALTESEDGETELEDDSLLGVKAVAMIPPVAAAGRRRAAMTTGRSVSFRQAPLTATAGGSMSSKLEQALGGSGSSSGALREESDAEMIMMSTHDHGLPGSRDTETHGKILPCHKVKEDGIVRITPATMEELLAGTFDHELKEFHVIDCRFDYEFNGGHIEGATNLTTPEAVSDFFLKEVVPPRPTESGERLPGSELKTIIIFHCEFSAKRGPTFAKHLRAQDRKTCQEVYPKVHYPEVYILEGGYKAYYEAFPARCQGYTRMDDPEHLEARRERMDHLRRWERTRSYTYGERTAAVAALSEPTSAATVEKKSATGSRPMSTNGAFGNPLTLGRRGGGAAAAAALSTLEEHDDTSLAEGDSACSVGGPGSPCPPPVVMAVGKPKTTTTFTMLKPAAPKRATLDRAATFGRLNFGAAGR